MSLNFTAAQLIIEGLGYLQQGAAMEAPITELANDITDSIDLAEPSGIVRLLQQCDAQIFTGWRQYQSLYDTRTLSTIIDIAAAASSVIKEDDGCIVLSGCGTSGRIAFTTACTFNKILLAQGWQPCFTYTIAGGDRALLISTEAPEDSCAEGVSALRESVAGKSRVLYIGISCGLSAPFVAGQLQYCLDHPDQFTPVLVGFNTVNMARRNPINNWDKTFYDVAQEMEAKTRNCFILNPVVGGEAITGSSRMKGGSATKILLEVTFSLALQMMTTSSSVQLSAVQQLLMGYELVYRATYLNTDSIAQLVEAAGTTLRSGGRLCYLGVSSYGCLSMIDASECPPTYGTAYDDVRGFLLEGWAGMGNKEGELAKRGPKYHISWDDFDAEKLPNLSQSDLVIMVLSEDNLQLPQVDAMRQKVQQQCNRLGSITVCCSTESRVHCSSKLAVEISLPSAALLALAQSALPQHASAMLQPYCEIAVKWVLNAITTGAHVLKGKVLRNYMVDLQVSNTKLYHRAISIIQEFTHVKRDYAEEKLLSVVYNTDQVTPTIRAASIVSHIERAAGMASVVPTAILLAKGCASLMAAQKALIKTPIVRQALQE